MDCLHTFIVTSTSFILLTWGFKSCVHARRIISNEDYPCMTPIPNSRSQKLFPRATYPSNITRWWCLHNQAENSPLIPLDFNLPYRYGFGTLVLIFLEGKTTNLLKPKLLSELPEACGLQLWTANPQVLKCPRKCRDIFHPTDQTLGYI